MAGARIVIEFHRHGPILTAIGGRTEDLFVCGNAINSRHTPVFSSKLHGLGGEFQPRYKCFKQEISRQTQVDRGLSQDNNKRNEVFTVNRIKIRLIIAAIGSALLLGSGISMAQDSDGAVKYGEENDDARYIRVTFVSYKPGMAGRAYTILREHYAPAGEAAGLEGPVAIHFQTGPFDAAYHWRLENGMSDMEWQRSPNQVKFRAAMAELEGSEEAAQAVRDSYNATIARTVTTIGHRHVSDDEE